MILSEIGKAELAALQRLTDATRALPKPTDGRYEFPLMDKLEIKDWEPNKGIPLLRYDFGAALYNQRNADADADAAPTAAAAEEEKPKAEGTPPPAEGTPHHAESCSRSRV